MPATRIVEGVDGKATTYITSSSGLKAVLTKHGTWRGSVLTVTGSRTASGGNGSTLGSCSWFSTGVQLQSWLYDGGEPTYAVVDAT